MLVKPLFDTLTCDTKRARMENEGVPEDKTLKSHTLWKNTYGRSKNRQRVMMQKHNKRNTILCDVYK